MDLDSHGEDSYGDIPPGFQSPLSLAPYTNYVETNLATLAGVAGEEVANMMGEDVNLAPSNIPTMPSDVNSAPSPIAVGLRRGRKKKSEKEREEFWSRRPDWLPEGWEMDVRLRKDGATAGIRDRYYHEPRSGRRFRSRKEVEKFIQTGEVPRYKPKPKIEKSNVENINSEPTPSGNIAWPPTLEPYSKHLPSFMGGGKSNQQSEVGGTIIEQDGTESTIGIQQPVPSNVDGLETMFNVERENAIGRAHQSEINTQEKGVPKSKSRKKSDLKKETRGMKPALQEQKGGPQKSIVIFLNALEERYVKRLSLLTRRQALQVVLGNNKGV
ncbi:hypothetical protein MRB53_023837 [Persea americana]|uniref:Uncharacterized protein n=1 Tax=Persea americana TaxID=3435 RepID=A0ACC2LAN1_PERAE|nr:hypothetical protein MRB53_023837 [Persea americana]